MTTSTRAGIRFKILNRYLQADTDRRRLENSGLEPGNHTLWVRLTGPEGISAPVGITIHLADPLPDSGAEAELPLLLLAGGLLVLLSAASVFFWRRSASS